MVSYNYGVGLSVAALAITTAYYFFRKKDQENAPKKWKKAGKVTNLLIYPLKSGYRMELRSAECTELGIITSDHKIRDRCLVVYDASSKEVRTAHGCRKLALIQVKETDDSNTMILSAPDFPDFIMQIPEPKGEPEMLKIHGEKTFMTDCGYLAGEWVSEYILGTKEGLRIGYNDGTWLRKLEGDYKELFLSYPLMKTASLGLYSSVASYLLVNQSSVNDLKTRIKNVEGVSVHNFRSNIVVETSKPYVEDQWKWIKIGEAIFQVIKPCVRCLVTNIDPDTNDRLKSYEPITTMKKYRSIQKLYGTKFEENCPVMGIYLNLIQPGTVCLEEDVYVGE